VFPAPRVRSEQMDGPGRPRIATKRSRGDAYSDVEFFYERGKTVIMTPMDVTNYEEPQLVEVGTLAALTGDNTGIGPSQGLGLGKGSICSDGASGLVGNRSFNSGRCR
jgi:hypothetical protein